MATKQKRGELKVSEEDKDLLKAMRTIRKKMKMPEVVCLCGSTKFWKVFRDKGLELALEGKIVLSIGIAAPDSITLANPDNSMGVAKKDELDVLHKHKINLADSVLVLNVGGYVGDSTKSEIKHARMTGVPVKYLEPPEDYV